ncbi:hypothetical protein KM043_014278 [Ampulex compressa]|nr:hypothetical protein KM043_014278 [Ampulex compressa]
MEAIVEEKTIVDLRVVDSVPSLSTDPRLVKVACGASVSESSIVIYQDFEQNNEYRKLRGRREAELLIDAIAPGSIPPKGTAGLDAQARLAADNHDDEEKEEEEEEEEEDEKEEGEGRKNEGDTLVEKRGRKLPYQHHHCSIHARKKIEGADVRRKIPSSLSSPPSRSHETLVLQRSGRGKSDKAWEDGAEKQIKRNARMTARASHGFARAAKMSGSMTPSLRLADSNCPANGKKGGVGGKKARG